MATIKVKKSRKPDFLRGNSANRRHARRKVEAIAIKDIEMQLDSIFQLETKKLNRVEKTLSLSHIPVTRSIEPKYQSSPDNCCLPDVLIFSGVKTKMPRNKFRVTAR
ncbi:MAG TPA: hypothetical protein DIS95_01155 [Proteus vulgaris]|uniref:Uncharacterized protein n=1 Tax=Proteus mirabilis TaxID=584 RepID=A0A379FGJ5_PROMI|nr:hypothetical protein [Proteus mirabilis]HCN41012.1 hypothetical protein [Proteus vulgaris]EEI47925.1 hypothetical protein HMPREF0693_2180 [Proteus mirabilis ATCC 29906]MBI6412946.1 hypothetical protein [Proteus mirabilis]SUC18954.1 Uncharacterised protein [Proteus mirabilis]HBC7459913.1 hypothetical protein [Proteus mirabilis]